jgi:hypothetical protein
MKKFIFTLVITTVATRLLAAAAILTVIVSVDGNLEIIASGPSGPLPRGYDCVLQSTTDFTNWTAISTNKFPFDGLVTNVVQTTNTMEFYRVEVR